MHICAQVIREQRLHCTLGIVLQWYSLCGMLKNIHAYMHACIHVHAYMHLAHAA